MESVYVPEEEQEQTICLPLESSKADRVAFQQCDVFEKKGSPYRVKCRICGLKVTTSSHKIIYGHYLRDRGVQIAWCIASDKLQADYPEFMEALQDRQASLRLKRK